MIELQMPWPPAKLSPNVRNHWAQLYTAKKSYREECFIATRNQLKGVAPYGPLLLELEFVPPDRRSRDRDNLVARFKAGIDGIAEALRVDDKVFTTLITRVAPKERGGFVRVKISKDKNGQETV